MKRPPRIARTIAALPDKDADKRKPDHLADVRQLPCLLCGTRPSDPHHLFKNILGRGMGMKAADRYVIPLTRDCHNKIHASGNDEEYLAARGFMGREIAGALWANRGDVTAMERIIFRARQVAASKLRALPAAKANED